MFALIYSNEDDSSKIYKAKIYYLPKDIIKHYNDIVNGENLYDQPIDSDIKRYKDTRKLTTRQDEGYTVEKKS